MPTPMMAVMATLVVAMTPTMPVALLIIAIGNCLTVIRNSYISGGSIYITETQAHVSGISRTAIGITPDRDASGHRDSTVITRRTRMMGHNCGSTEKTEYAKQQYD
jgi:membrane protein insertase Oxa1/YidC/SpoIIIJ